MTEILGGIVVDGILRAIKLVADLKRRAEQAGVLSPEQKAVVRQAEMEAYGWADRPAPPPPPGVTAP